MKFVEDDANAAGVLANLVDEGLQNRFGETVLAILGVGAGNSVGIAAVNALKHERYEGVEIAVFRS